MNIKSRNIYLIYLLLYFSLLVGFYLNEDFSLGSRVDYFQHKISVAMFEKDFMKTLLSFGEEPTSHSPIFYIFFLFLKKVSFNENIARLINLHLSLFIPYFFYLCLRLKYNFHRTNLKSLIPCIIFLSPYFRAGAIWIGSENISLLFLIISFYFFLKYEFDKEKNFSNIFLNVLFLACAAYFRPIYAIFSIYFFLRFYLDLKLSNKLLYYILTNVFLSFPALYYVFILDINFFLIHINHTLELSRFVNQYSICFSIVLFYSIPFLLANINNNLKLSIFRIENIVLSIIFTYLLLFHFDYNVPYGGGIFYKFSLLIFNNNYLFYFFSLIAFNVLLAVLFLDNDIKDRISNLILLLVLISLESDRVIYHETYDPLLYFIFFLLIKSRIYLNFTWKLTNKKFILLILFSISFLALSIVNSILNQAEMQKQINIIISNY